MTEKERLIQDFHVFTENPTSRVPICLCVDISGSMQGNKIDSLNAGLRQFIKELCEDDVAQYAAEVCIIGFGGNSEVKLICDFTSVTNINPPILPASGNTPIGKAVEVALDRLNARKELYKSVGNHYYQPWLVIMTDGLATDDPTMSASVSSQMVNDRKLTVLPIAIGAQADVRTLQMFSPKTPPLFLDELKFSEFFEWLSKSVSRFVSSKSSDTFEPNFQKTKWTSVK